MGVGGEPGLREIWRRWRRGGVVWVGVISIRRRVVPASIGLDCATAGTGEDSLSSDASTVAAAASV